MEASNGADTPLLLVVSEDDHGSEVQEKEEEEEEEVPPYSVQKEPDSFFLSHRGPGWAFCTI